MAFRIPAVLDVEYRGSRSGVAQKTGNQWLSLMFEDKDCNQISVSVPAEMIGDVYHLGMVKGERYFVAIVATARADGNSYVMLTALPELQDED